MNKKKKSVVILFFFIVQIFLPYYVLWTSCFSQQDYTNVCLLEFIYLLFFDECVLRRCICYRITGLELLLRVCVWWKDNMQTCYHTYDSSLNKITKQWGPLHTYIIPNIINTHNVVLQCLQQWYDLVSVCKWVRQGSEAINNATYGLHHHEHLRKIITEFFLISIRVELATARVSLHVKIRTASLSRRQKKKCISATDIIHPLPRPSPQPPRPGVWI